LEARAPLVLSLIGDAVAGERLAEVWMAEAHRFAHEPGTTAARA